MDIQKTNTIAPSIRVRDIQQSIGFYTRTLGFMTLEKHICKNGDIVVATVGLDSPMLMLLPFRTIRTHERKEEFQQKKPGIGVRFRFGMTGTRTLDEYFAEVKRKGATIVEEPKTEFWGDRMFTILDPDGYTLTFSEHVQDVSPAAWVNAYEREHQKPVRIAHKRSLPLPETMPPISISQEIKNG
jgi:uncharacterized glyoxalase superfamily protein PhnB